MIVGWGMQLVSSLARKQDQENNRLTNAAAPRR